MAEKTEDKKTEKKPKEAKKQAKPKVPEKKEAKVETKPEPKAERKPEQKAVQKTETKPVPKPEAHQKAPEAPKAQAKAEAVHPQVHAHPAHAAPSAPAAAPAAPASVPAKKKAKKKAAPSEKVVVARGKRKESVARATIRKGDGTIRVNSVNVNALNNRYISDLIKEPLKFVGPKANGIRISVTVAGGGMMGQAQAARTAIANALVEYFDDEQLAKTMDTTDRFLLIEDSRRVEPKKYKGPKARARFQKSYR